MFVFKTAVVGAGTMGAEIAAAIAVAGIPVILSDPDAGALDAALERAEAVIRRQLDAQVAAGRASAAQARAQLEAARALIGETLGVEGLGDVDLVIETVPERIDLKREVLAALDAATPGHAILASNTSSLSIAELAGATTRPERVLGIHFFHPAATMRLVELVEGLETSSESMATATSFAAAIRKTSIRCVDSPGFVVNRVLCSAVGELWRAQEEGGLAIGALDRAVASAKVAPVGPFMLCDQLGLDTVLAVAERLRTAYGERFHVHGRLRELVAGGQLGAKTGGRGFYRDGEPDGGGEDVDAEALAERFTLKALVESCLLLEEGVASAREIDVALAAGAGLQPPFASADAAGLDVARDRLEQAAQRWGEHFAAPVVLRRLLAQGRIGASARQGFFPTPRPDPGQDGPVKLETRGEVAIAWIDDPPANSISPAVVAALGAAWEAVTRAGDVRALVIASANPALFCAGADIKTLATMDAAASAELVERMHALLADIGRSRVVTVAAVNGFAYGGGCELAMAADVRIAAQSASFAQPEIKLGIIPGWGGTQRLPRLVGASKALEMNLLGEPIDAVEAWEYGLVNRVVADHELIDVALAWARRLAAAAPLAVEQIKRVSGGDDLEAGLAAERAAFVAVFGSADAREGTSAFVEKRAARFSGR